MEYKNLIVEQKKEVLYITINRPDKLNALNQETLKELNFAILEVINNSTIGGAIITGYGEKAFVAGADISEFTGLNKETAKKLATNAHQNIFDLIENSTKPFIAAINGFALGGGLELALACHIRVATQTAKFGLPEVGLGLIPGYGGTQRLSQITGKGIAFELILTGQVFDSEKAFKHAIINHIVPQEELLQKSEEILHTILSKSPEAINHAIRAINAAFEKKIDGYKVEIESFSSCFDSKNLKEGVNAFLEKRKANFKRK